MNFVKDGLVDIVTFSVLAIFNPSRFVIAPFVIAFDDDRFGSRSPCRHVARSARCRIALVPIEIAMYPTRIGIDEQFIRVKSIPLLVAIADITYRRPWLKRRIVFPVGPPSDITVMLPNPESRNEKSPQTRSRLANEWQTHRRRTRFGVVEQQNFDTLGILGIDDEIDALIDERRTHVCLQLAYREIRV